MAPRRRRQWIALPAAAYALCLLLVVFWPVPVDRYGAGGLQRLLAWLHGHGLPRWFDYGLVEWLANVVMFLPFGFLLAAVLAPRRWWTVPVAALTVSMAIELVQYAVLRDRFASPADVAANTLGAFVGLFACLAVFRRTATYRAGHGGGGAAWRGR